jgi:SP family myo-inositol transporter-like MFS transporter 13
MAIASMIFYLLIFGVGMSPMPWAINAEIYPLRYRAKALSIATGVNWLSNYIVSATFLDVATALSTAHQDKDKHPDGAFWLYAAISAAGWWWLYLRMPETKGKSLEEIEALFAGTDTGGDCEDDRVSILAASHHDARSN